MNESRVLEFTELVLPVCTRLYGSSPCVASLGVTGNCKCYNSPATCQDPFNFEPGEEVIRMAVPTADLPVDYDYIPNIKNIAIRAQRINPGESVGTRESLTSSHFNHRHNDSGFDKYIADRGFNPFNTGTYWGKFVARWPNIQGYEYRYVKGFVGQAIEAMERRYYIVESTSGPDNSGGFSITAKDAIKFFDGEKSVVPRPSLGSLLDDITDADTSCTLSPAGVGDLYYPASGIASMGDEKVSFTRVGDVITLTGRGLSGSKLDEHKLGETFQLAEVFSGAEPSDILFRVISEFTDTPSEYLDLEAWQAETTLHIGRLFSAEIMKPTAVKKIVDELIEQVGLVIYSDTVNKKIAVKALRNLVPVLSISDDTVLENSFSTKFDSDKRITQLITYYAQKNPLEKIDDVKNYAAILNSFSGNPINALEGASDSIKTIFSRWISIFNRTAAEAVNDYKLLRYERAPRSCGFKLPVFIPIALGSVFTVSSSEFEDSQGNPMPALSFQAVSVEPTESGCTVLGEELFANALIPDDGICTINIDTDSYNLNLRAVYDSIYLPPEAGTEIRFVVAAGVQIGSYGIYLNSITVGDFPDDVVLKIYMGVGARFQGAGGDGGVGPYQEGRPGGTAFFTRKLITIYGDEEIWGGGGGAGGISYLGSPTAGGGGAGNVPGVPSATTEHGGPSFTTGGDPGEPGGGGASPGGDAGIAIDGVSFVTFSGTPDIRGPQIN